MTTTISATDEIAAAEARLVALKGRLGAGDDTPVTADDLHRAESALRFACWQRDALEAAELRRAERERLGRIERIRAELPTRLDEAALTKARAKMAAAIDAFIVAGISHDAALSSLMAELGELGPLPRGLALNDVGVGTLTDGPTSYRRAPIQRAIAEEATLSLKRHLPRTQIDLNRPRD